MFQPLCTNLILSRLTDFHQDLLLPARCKRDLVTSQLTGIRVYLHAKGIENEVSLKYTFALDYSAPVTGMSSTSQPRSQ